NHEESNREQLHRLAQDTLALARNTLAVNLRFMDKAISMLHVLWQEDGGCYTVNGEVMRLDPKRFLQEYTKEPQTAAHAYMHMLLHCVFQHFFVGLGVDSKRWDLACDIAVEATMDALELPAITIHKKEAFTKEFRRLRLKVKYLTAEMIYRYLTSGKVSEEEVDRLEELFRVDDHGLWYEGKFKDESALMETDEKVSSQENTVDGPVTEDDISSTGITKEEAGNNNQAGRGQNQKLRDEWKKVSNEMQMNLLAFTKELGERREGLMQNLYAVNRERYDYGAFLKKFATFGETMRVNEDEFDYIFYTYGMGLYGNMPLIEPLEYKEVNKIREFVIAIDTSGSTQGELVQTFVQKTFNILNQHENFFSKVNLHMIQCDETVQEDVKITNREEMEEYCKNLELKGFGGTDYRPVFTYVKRLIDKKEFENLKGMIYFTDGQGIFPEKQPPVKVAFVYVSDGYRDVDVPTWAIKLVLEPEEIEKVTVS
ncbi:MAG: VWA-like domain-containing protein, partial [Lachnospiraceae bacterium]|nr:VWA-like domain-containing protein [Lachnospiraceae bacterium]